MITGTKVNFVYVESGASIPTPVDESTIYYLEDAQQMYVGSHLIADSSKIQDIKINGASAVDPSTHEASIELPYNICINSIPSTPTAIATFSDGAEMVMPSLKVDIEPQQDLHGYDSPWAGGAGKNKFDMDNISEIQSTAEERRNGQVYEGVGTFTVSASANTLSGNFIYSRTYKNGVYSSADTIATDSVHSSKTYTLAEGDKLIVFDALMHTITESKQVFAPAKVMIEQDSTATSFAPYSNICPISGWDECNVSDVGVNVWDEEWEVGGINHTTGQNTETTGVIRSKNPIRVDGNTNYNFLKKTGNIDFHIHWYDANKNFISYKEIYSSGSVNYKVDTSPQNAVYMRFNLTAGYGTTYNNDISINYPSTDTSYHAYNGQTYTIDLDGTRYGGTLDVVSGELVVDRVKLTNDYLVNASYESAGRGCFALIGITLKSMSSDVVDTKLMASALKTSSQTDLYTNKNVGIAHWWNTRIGFSTGDETITTVSAFKQWLALNGSDVVYELATPITIQLTPTAVKSLEGTNNVFADSGEILEGEYIANSSYVVDVAESIIKLGVDDITLAKNFADEYDASTSYEVGDLCTKDLVLYRCTTATTGTWDDTKWESATIAEILDDIKTIINSLMVDIDIEVISRLIQKDELLDIMNYGDQLNINWANGTTNYDMPLNLCHLETAKDENDNDVKVADFESEYVLPFDCVFDAPEAIFASASDLEAGDYYFKIVNDAWGGNNGKYVSFTLDATLEAGKQIRKKSGGYNAAIENCTLGIFTDGTDTTGTTLSFTVSTTQPSTGTNLGQTDGTGDLNYWHCVVLGYNRWKFSAVRQFLNSDATKGNWWVQQHKWDVMPSYATTADGFLYGLSASIKQHLKTTKIQTARNTVFNSGDTPLGDFDITYDKVFLASLEQMYIEPQVTGEGDVWEYYKLLNGTSTKYQRSSTYADLIKYDISAKTTARYRWLRSCYRSTASNEWLVNSSGGVYGDSATRGLRLAPAMRIG